MRDDAVALQVVYKIRDLTETLAFHYDKCAEHGFLWETFSTRVMARQLKVQYAEELVVKPYDALGCEKAYVLNYFLSIDSGPPPSGFVLFIVIIPVWGSAFYIP